MTWTTRMTTEVGCLSVSLVPALAWTITLAVSEDAFTDGLNDTRAGGMAGALARAFRKEASRQGPRALPQRITLGDTARWPQDLLKPRSRFAMKEDDLCKEAKREVEVFVRTATDPLPNLLRSEVYVGAQSAATMDKTKKDILKYLGFVVNVKRWPAEAACLSVYGNVDMFFDYLSFLLVRGVAHRQAGCQ